MTMALDGHADVNSTEPRTPDGTADRPMRVKPFLGK